MNDLQQRIRDLRTVERRVTPDAAWVRATRETLMTRAARVMGDEAMKRERLHVVMGSVVGTVFNRYIRKPIVAVASFLVIAIGGSLMSVSAAERALPGDFLYGLKLATEQAQLALISTKQDKLKRKTEFTERRVQELQQVSVQKDNAKVQQVAEILKSDLTTLKEQLGDVKTSVAPDAVADVAKLVDQKTSEAIVALQQSKADLSPATKQTVTEAQSAAADAGVQAIEVLVEQHQTSSSTIPVADVAEAIQNHANAVANIMQQPIELPEGVGASATSTTSTVDALIQSIATTTASTVTNGTSTTPLPELVTQVKDMTAQVFAIQKASEQLEVTESDASSTDADANLSTSGTQTTVTSTPSDTPPGTTTSTSSTQESS